MKKLCILFSLFNLLILEVYAQVPNWEWAKSAIASTHNGGGGEGVDVTTDRYENLYFGGMFTDTIKFNSITLISPEGLFLVKYDSSGNLLWAKSSIGRSISFLNMATDANGNTFITGSFLDSVLFDTIQLIGTSSIGNFFLVKYDANGNAIWGEIFGADYDEGTGVAIDSMDNIYMSGYFISPTITFGNFTLTNSGVRNSFIVKFNSVGNVVWAKKIGGTNDDIGNAVATDVLGNIYLAGAFTSPVLFIDTFTLSNVTNSNFNFFLCKYDPSGNVLWVRSAGDSLDIFPYKVSVDQNNNIYAVGDLACQNGICAPVHFGSYFLGGTTNFSDIFLAKYNSSGNVLWAKSFHGLVDCHSYCLSANNKNVYFTGSLDSNIVFDNISLQRPTGSHDPMFITSCDSSGAVVFAKVLSSGGDDQCGITVASSGNIYIGGDMTGVSFEVFGLDTVVCIGYEDPFVAKLNSGVINNVIDLNKFEIITISPNPFYNEINIVMENNQSFDITLFDISCRVLQIYKRSSSIIINTEGLARGIYFLQLINKNGEIYVSKIVKQ